MFDLQCVNTHNMSGAKNQVVILNKRETESFCNLIPPKKLSRRSLVESVPTCLAKGNLKKYYTFINLAG